MSHPLEIDHFRTLCPRIHLFKKQVSQSEYSIWGEKYCFAVVLFPLEAKIKQRHAILAKYFNLTLKMVHDISNSENKV